jgi:hypothetical protein
MKGRRWRKLGWPLFLATLSLVLVSLILSRTSSAQSRVWEEGYCPAAQDPTATPVASGVQIPVIVNIYPGATVSETYARAVISEVNAILRQAAMRMVVIRVTEVNSGTGGAGYWGGDNGAGGGTAGDGGFTRDERDNVRTFGSQELNELPNEKGIKISFGITPSVTSDTPGVSVHRNPTLIVRRRDTVTDTAQTIAHELGHVMTLGPGHVISGTTVADDAGHAPDRDGPVGNGNLMAPSNRRTGTHLTPEQIAEMRWRRYVHGKCATQWEHAYPATQDEQQFGTTTDVPGDQTSADGIHDLSGVFITSLAGQPTLEIQITVAGTPSPPVSATYGLGFDSDGNVGSGVPYAGLEGVDKVVVVALTATLDAVDTAGYVYDPGDGTWTPLVVPPLLALDTEFDVLEGAGGESVATSFLLEVPKELLSLTAIEVPVIGAAGQGPVAEPYDVTAPFVFDTERWLDDPTLTTVGDGVPVPGAPYSFTVSGLAPDARFALSLNGRVVHEDVLDGSGAAGGAFIFPEAVSPRAFHFLTAQDPTGEFAYSITCPDREVVFLPLLMRDT